MFGFKPRNEVMMEVAVTSLIFAALLFLIGVNTENTAPRGPAPITRIMQAFSR